MMENKAQWNFTSQELLFYMERADIQAGDLSLIPQAQEDMLFKDQMIEERSEMKSEDLQLLEQCIRVLANPDRLLQIHINLADGLVSRVFLAMAQSSPGLWVGLGHEEEGYRILLHGDTELKYGLIDSLAAGVALGETRIACDFSTPAALAFLAVLDQYKRSHMLAMLNHADPIFLFEKKDIQDHLAGAHVQDFRWLLPFTDKLMPLRIHDLELAQDPGQALAELVELGIIANMDEESRLFDLEPITLSMAEGYRQKISLAGISHTTRLDTGELLHDVFVIIRTPGDLLLTVMSGAEASFVGISAEELQNLLDSLFISTWATEETQEEQAKTFCQDCGRPVGSGEKFCRHCGSRL